ncbi:MAG: hypothetical protein ACRDGK_01160 [Actinomycetota bacterium]
MPIGRRLSSLLMVLVLVGAPAVVLRMFCVGNSCDGARAVAPTSVPFCPLPEELRRQIAAGFREGRSPDVMAATTGAEGVAAEVQRGVRVSWPGQGTRSGGVDTRVPVVFFGSSVRATPLPRGVGLDAIAPTLERIIGLRRPHPEVRTGEAIDGVAAAGETPLVVLIAWKRVGTPDLEARSGAWPFLRRAMAQGAGTLEAVAGSLPMDPSATLTTIGTGSLPSTHGITGTLVREDDGDVSSAWSAPGAGSVIATLADDLDHVHGQRAGVGAVLTDEADRGIIGNGWYLDASDRDPLSVLGSEASHPAIASRAIVTSEGLGEDDVTDVLGVVIGGSVARIDARTEHVVTTVRALVPRATFVVTGTGSRAAGAEDAASLAAGVDDTLGAPIVEGTGAAGLFLDRGVSVDRSITADQVARALAGARTPGGDASLFADVFPSFAVAFSRYC